MPSKHPPLVYIVRDRHGYLKIGTTSNLDQRLTALSRLCAGKVDLLITLPGGRILEESLHAKFRSDVVHGEYFKPSKELLAFVEEAKEAQREKVMRESGAASPAASHTARAFFTRPAWLAIQTRDGLPTCPCVRVVDRAGLCASGSCPHCHGAGVLPLSPEAPWAEVAADRPLAATEAA